MIWVILYNWYYMSYIQSDSSVRPYNSYFILLIIFFLRGTVPTYNYHILKTNYDHGKKCLPTLIITQQNYIIDSMLRNVLNFPRGYQIMHIIIFYNVDFGRAVISSYRYCIQTWFRLPRVGLRVKNFENFQTSHP